MTKPFRNDLFFKLTPLFALYELADHFGISAERIRQLEKNAIGKLKQLIA